MTNAATMGPPPSPKEPRRSGRRSVPSASASKSPGGSPTSDSAPKSKEAATQRPNPPPPPNSNRGKKSKQEEIDEPLEDNHKNGASTTNGRAKRKGKEKEKPTLAVDVQVEEYARNGDVASKDGGDDAQEDDEQGVTRCPCEVLGEEDLGEGTMVMCEDCHTWQHGFCMGFPTEELIPDSYFCEQCRPEMYPDLIKKLKKARQSSTHHQTAATAQPRNSRSHSPISHLKQTKRRNTMNSRDAAYDESLRAVIDASAAEAANATSTRPNAELDEESVAGHLESVPEPEVVQGGRKKRKRADDDAASAKRTRSASIASDWQAMPPPRDPTPSSTKAPAPPSSTAPKPAARAKRPGARKGQVQEALVPAEGEEAGSTPPARRQGNQRAKASGGNESGTRRNQTNGTSNQGTSAGAHTATVSASRAYHSSHAYAVSQQPLLTSWSLPDYLAHLSHILPTETPRPLEVRGFGISTNGQESMERTTERGVKVKWPSKRMSVGDMNKRVRALVEWVGREQASAAERIKRKEAIEKTLQELHASSGEDSRTAPNRSVEGSSGDARMVLDGDANANTPPQEKQPTLNGTHPPNLISDTLDTSSETMKMMEELMEELISFQERFGPGAKVKERERRPVS